MEGMYLYLIMILFSILGLKKKNMSLGQRTIPSNKGIISTCA